MKNNHLFAGLLLVSALLLGACGQTPEGASQQPPVPAPAPISTTDQVLLDTFADLQILRYELPGFDKLDLRQKTFIYYLSEAALAGRDIIYDQHCKHNLAVRKTLEGIHASFKGDRNSADWKAFATYSKRVWFSNGIHHHYSETKILPEFTKAYFTQLVQNSDPATFPLQPQENADGLLAKLIPVIFDPADVAGIDIGTVERRGEQQNQAVAASDEVFVHCRHRLRSTSRVGNA